MYDVIVRDKKETSVFNNRLFSKKQVWDEENTKIVISHKVVDSLSDDMQRFSDIMAKTILEGLLNGRR